MNDAVSDYLDYYLDEAPPGRGAVLLTGSWGAGKTHFINGYIERREAERKEADPLIGPGHLYASLYGVRAPEDVSAQFFAQTNPLLSSGVARLLGSAASRVVNTLTRGQVLKDDDSKAVREFLTRDIKSLTLIFDDLERCAAPIAEMMGYINTFVEREGTKVILLASEADIPQEQQQAYARRKEKLVGKTLEVQTKPIDVYRIWTKEMRNDAAREAAAHNEALALRTFHFSGSGNLRSLRAVLDDFDRLVEGVDPALSRSPPALARVLTYMVATGTEVRAGALRSTDLPSLSSVRLSALMAERGGRAMTEEAKTLASIAGKYPEVDWNDSVVSAESLGKLYVSGIIEREQIDARLGSHPLTRTSDDVPSWRLLWYWGKCELDLYKALRSRFLADLGQHAFTCPGPILHCAGLAITLRNNGDDLFDGRPIPDFFSEYIEALEANCTLVPAIETLEADHEGGYDGLGYVGKQTEDFKLIHELLCAAVNRRSAKLLKDAAPAFLDALRKGEEHYHGLYEYGRGEEGRFGAGAILQYISTEDFASLCIVDGRYNDRITAALDERYRRDRAGQISHQEDAWLDKLISELEHRADHLPPPHRLRALTLVNRFRQNIAGIREGRPALSLVVVPRSADPPISSAIYANQVAP